MAIKFTLTFVVQICQKVILNEILYSHFSDSLLIYENKYYLQVYLDNCAYKIVDKPMMDYLGENPFETDEA